MSASEAPPEAGPSPEDAALRYQAAHGAHRVAVGLYWHGVEMHAPADTVARLAAAAEEAAAQMNAALKVWLDAMLDSKKADNRP